MADTPEASLAPESEPEAAAPEWGLHAGHLAALGLLLVLTFYARMIPLGPGLAWQAIAPPYEDGHPSTLPGWLGEKLYRDTYVWGARRSTTKTFVATMAGAAEALRGLHTALSLALGLLAVWAYGRKGGGIGQGALGLLFLFPSAPQLVAFIGPDLLGLICFLALLGLFAGREPGLLSLTAAPLVLLLWANLGMSFLMGLALLSALTVGRALEAIGEQGLAGLVSWPVLGQAGSLLASVGLVAIGTPEGLGLLSSLTRYASSSALPMLAFYQPLDFSDPRPAHWVFLGSLALLALAQAFTDEGFSPTEMTVLLTFALLALWRQGLLGYWLLTFPWLLLPRISERFAELPPLEKTPRYALVGGAMALLLLAQAAPWVWLVRGESRPLSQLLAEGIPWALARQLRAGAADTAPVSRPLADLVKDAYPEGKLTGGVFATGEAADFLARVLPQGLRLFAWGDPGLLPEERWRGFVAIQSGRADWWEIVDDAGINLLVLSPRRDASLLQALKEDEAWLVTSAGDGVEAAVRRKPISGR
jgi:hypothetical protein